jgi:hypothetical protein
MVSRASSCRLSIWTTPVSHGRSSRSNGTRRVRSSSQRAAAERMKIRVPGHRAPNALMISTWREAWPKPWPLM